jgi:hypothetical protein
VCSWPIHAITISIMRLIEERTAEGNNMNTLSSSPKKNISAGDTTVKKQGITANKIQIEIQADKKNRNDRSKWLTVTLSESLTFTMFHATGSIISSVQENVSDDVKNINNQDKEKPKKQDNVTQSRDRSMQTLNKMQKVSLRSRLFFLITLTSFSM